MSHHMWAYIGSQKFGSTCGLPLGLEISSLAGPIEIHPSVTYSAEFGRFTH